MSASGSSGVTSALWRYARQKERLGRALLPLVSAFGLVAAASVLPWRDGTDGLAGWWVNWLDPFLAAATVLLALALWVSGLRDRWKASLPKTLTVHFALEPEAGGEPEYVYSCYDAYLAGESDIRTWGQQIGQQMNGGGLLSFFPYLYEKGPDLTCAADGRFHLAYEVTIHLRRDDDPRYVVRSEGYTVWYRAIPWYLEDGPRRNEAIHLPERPKGNPLSPEEAQARLKEEDSGQFAGSAPQGVGEEDST